MFEDNPILLDVLIIGPVCFKIWLLRVLGSNAYRIYNKVGHQSKQNCSFLVRIHYDVERISTFITMLELLFCCWAERA